MIKFFKKNSGVILIIILVVLPLLNWLLLKSLALRFGNLKMTMTSLGQISGLAGMVLFSLNLILSGRFKFLDKYIFGLDRLYKNHHQLGVVAFVLLLLHPLLLAYKYWLLSFSLALSFLLPSANWAVNYGIVALALMIVLMILTLFVKIKYPKWKLSHKFMVVVFVLAILHTFFIVSDISRDLVLRVYVLGLAILGLLSGFYRSFLSHWFNDYYNYEVAEVLPLNQNIVSIKLTTKGKPLKYQSGQFIFVSFKSDAVSQEIHPFSLCSVAGDLYVQLVVKSLGDYTGNLKNLKVGDKALLEGPFGRFFYKKAESSKQIWLAGGVGITPFYSMAKDLDDNYEVDLYYCVSDSSEAVLLKELLSIADNNKKFRVFVWASKDKGRISIEQISQYSQSLSEKDIFLCGPEPFMENLRKRFLTSGFKNKQIHWENFNLL